MSGRPAESGVPKSSATSPEAIAGSPVATGPQFPPGESVSTGSAAEAAAAGSSVYAKHGAALDRLAPGYMLWKIMSRLGGSLSFCLAVGFLPGLVLLLLADVVFSVLGLPPGIHETGLATIAGGLVVIIVVTAMDRSGIRLRRRKGHWTVVLKRRM